MRKYKLAHVFYIKQMQENTACTNLDNTKTYKDYEDLWWLYDLYAAMLA